MTLDIVVGFWILSYFLVEIPCEMVDVYYI